MLLTLAGLFRLAAGQRSSLADERQQSVQQDGGGQAGRLQQSVHSNLLHRRTESPRSVNAPQTRTESPRSVNAPQTRTESPRSVNASHQTRSDISHLVAVELQQDEHLQRGDVQRPASELQLSVTEPRPLQAARLRVTQTVHGLTWWRHAHTGGCTKMQIIKTSSVF